MNSLNPADSPVSELDEVLRKVNELALKSVKANYIYRGETQLYDKVSSSLYREYQEIIPGISDIEFLQRADLEEAKRYTQETDDDFAILTELQHYGGKTNLIDFTADYLIALFFACDGDYSKDGRVVLLDRAGDMEEHIYGPRHPASRVLAQKSVFVRPPDGFVVPDDTVIIPHNLKPTMLDYLQKGHGIATETVYNDLHGFIRSKAIHRQAFECYNAALARRNDKEYQAAIELCGQALNLNPRMSAALFVRGTTYLEIQELDSAIEDFNRVLELNSDHLDTYYSRGIAYYEKEDFDLAIEDYDKVTELDSDFYPAYVNRGVSYDGKGDFDRAISECSKALELNPNYAHAYNGRGIAYLHKGDFTAAIEDYDKAIQLAPDEAASYCNLGEAYLPLSEWGKARANLIAAKEMGADIVASFRNDYESVADFEQRTGLTLPDDIAEMLGG